MDVDDRARRSTRDGRLCALNEPPVPLQLMHCAADDANRPRLEAFVQDVFRHTYHAEVNTFCPGLLALHHPGDRVPLHPNPQGTGEYFENKATAINT